MALIIPICPNCGDIDLTESDVKVFAQAGQYYYRYRCSICLKLWINQIENTTAQVLLDAGVSEIFIELTPDLVPESVCERFDPVDLQIDYHIQLSDDSQIDACINTWCLEAAKTAYSERRHSL